MTRELPLTEYDGPGEPAPVYQIKSWCSCTDTDKRWFGQCRRCPDGAANARVLREVVSEIEGGEHHD